MIQHSTVISGVTATNKYVFTAGYDNRVICWDASNHWPIAVGYHDHFANHVSVSPCHTLVSSSGSDYSVRLWKIPSMELVSVLFGHTDDVITTSFSPTGKRIATASYDDTIGIFSINGDFLFRLSGHDGDVNTVFWKSENEVISAGDDGTIRQWDINKRLQRYVIIPEEFETDCVCNGPGQYFFAGNDTGALFFLHEGQIIDCISAHDAGIKHLEYIQHKECLISAGYDGRIILWDCSGRLPKKKKSFDVPSNVWPRSCAHIDKDKLAFATFGSTYATLDINSGIWDTSRIQKSVSINTVYCDGNDIYTAGDAGEVFKNFKKVATTNRLCNALQHCGSAFLVGGQSGEIIDIYTGKVLHAHSSPINGGVFSYVINGTNRAIFGSYDGKIIVFEADHEHNPHILGIFNIGNNSVKDITLGPLIGFALISTGDAVLFDKNTFKVIRSVPAHSAVANACVTTACGFASVGRDKLLLIWDEKGEIIHRVSTPHKHSIKAMCHHGNKLFLGDYRGCISVYDLSLCTFSEHRKISETGISSLASNEVHDVIISSYDGNVYSMDGNILTAINH